MRFPDLGTRPWTAREIGRQPPELRRCIGASAHRASDPRCTTHSRGRRTSTDVPTQRRCPSGRWNHDIAIVCTLGTCELKQYRVCVEYSDRAHIRNGRLRPHSDRSLRHRGDMTSLPRPENHAPGLPFRDLVQYLLQPLQDYTRRPGVHGKPGVIAPSELKKAAISKFIARWRTEVGDDVFPLFRLCMPLQG